MSTAEYRDAYGRATRSLAPVGHAVTQLPQPRHFRGSISERPRDRRMVTASNTHAFRHTPQPPHRFAFTRLIATWFWISVLDNKPVAHAAAASAASTTVFRSPSPFLPGLTMKTPRSKVWERADMSSREATEPSSLISSRKMAWDSLTKGAPVSNVTTTAPTGISLCFLPLETASV